METELAFWATSVTAADGVTFHPAVQSRQGGIRYWPNIRFATEHEAYTHAQHAIMDVMVQANSVTNGWNVVKL